MNDLRPCTDCGRHVRNESPSCPFCGALRAPAAARSPGASIAGGLTRAAIFAGAALLVPACGSSADETVEQEQVDQTSGGGGGEQTTDTQTTDTQTDVQQSDEHINIAQPYGAPPVDDPARSA